MEQWLGIQTLIWLFPIMFILHDFEEIIMVEKWLNKNATILYERLPKKMADRVMKQFSMSTAQFAVAVIVIFMFVSSSTFVANQYVNHGPYGEIYFFTVVTLTYFLHSLTHLAQSIFLRSITPGARTSLIIVIPYSLVLYHSLLVNKVITWNIIFVCLPFCLLLIPIALLAHWIGKKVI
ncbi:HXXEE domain-containing protein [Lysinibacillus sp. CNPSo 3705]|uniref:HXXEE domain-containing protein n=1 Tax=Lysinibacillus sp. CNPSo 3705 TaxID=3028148 RepID=UPI0023645477|nr:HXXEE domain-containing protein [Lysinibacillus sp. CNPSo 3705]MDD1505712.1 HXXEE domain-containing protein [Lysinibacillus sp. CNPSo 3705]